VTRLFDASWLAAGEAWERLGTVARRESWFAGQRTPTMKRVRPLNQLPRCCDNLSRLLSWRFGLEVPPAQEPLTEAPNLAAASAHSARARLGAPLAAVAAPSSI
jgi:hypothetical protein